MKKSLLLIALILVAILSVSGQSKPAPSFQDSVKSELLKVELTPEQAQTILSVLFQSKEVIDNSVGPLTPKQSKQLTDNLQAISAMMQEQFKKQLEASNKPKTQ